MHIVVVEAVLSYLDEVLNDRSSLGRRLSGEDLGAHPGGHLEGRRGGGGRGGRGEGRGGEGEVKIIYMYIGKKALVFNCS